MLRKPSLLSVESKPYTRPARSDGGKTSAGKERWGKAGEPYLLPDGNLTAQTLIRLSLWFCGGDLDHPSVQLGLVHIIDGGGSVSRALKLHISEASMGVRGIGIVGFW